MLIPGWLISFVDQIFGFAEDLINEACDKTCNFQIQALPPLAAYSAAWVIITVELAVMALLVLWPLGAGLIKLGYGLSNNASVGLPLKTRIRYAESGLRLRSIGFTLEWISGIRPRYSREVSADDLRKAVVVSKAARILRIVSGAVFILSRVLRGFLGLLGSAVRPSWLNLLRWSLVLVYLNSSVIAATSWGELVDDFRNANIPVTTIAASLGLLFLLVSTLWRGGHKWSGKFHEVAEAKCLEFLNATIRPLERLDSQLSESAEYCTRIAHGMINEAVENSSNGYYTIILGWNVESAKGHRHERWAPSQTYRSLGSNLDKTAITELSDAYSNLQSENWDRFLVLRSPPRIKNIVWRFGGEVEIWGHLLERLSPADLTKQTRSNSWFDIVESHLRSRENGIGPRKPDSEHPLISDRGGQGAAHSLDSLEVVDWLRDGVRQEIESLDRLITQVADSIASIRLTVRYARRETRATVPKRLLGSR